MQPSTLRDYDDRDMFCLFLLPGNNANRKVVPLFGCHHVVLTSRIKHLLVDTI